MQFFEILLQAGCLILLGMLSYGTSFRRYYSKAFQITTAILVIHLFWEAPRWQMYPTYLTLVIMGLLLLKKATSHLFWRTTGFISGLLLLSISTLYAAGMPISKWPKPQGPFTVGTSTFETVDPSREELFTPAKDDYRTLFVEVWYPANPDHLVDGKPVWRELYRGPDDHISFFTSYLESIPTYSMDKAPPATDGGPFPVILYNHGLQMFTSQNTQMMEHLASHGYVIVSISHPYESLRVNLSNSGIVIPEFLTSFEKFGEAMSWITTVSQPIVEAQSAIQHMEDEQKRAHIMLSAIEESPLNNVVENWVMDNQWVLHHLTDEKPNYLFTPIADFTRVGVMGMSVGGAAATELSKTDSLVLAAVNIDGIQYGKRNHVPLHDPFMMLYSDDAAGSNEFLKLSAQNDYHEYHIRGSRHADFTDMPRIWPVLGMYGQLGTLPRNKVTDLTNEIVLQFWDRYLKTSSQPWKPISFDEVKGVYIPAGM